MSFDPGLPLLGGSKRSVLVQDQCGFEEGELRCIFVESQPMGRPTMAWTIADAATGVIETGKVNVNDLRGLQPWPDAATWASSAAGASSRA